MERVDSDGLDIDERGISLQSLLPPELYLNFFEHFTAPYEEFSEAPVQLPIPPSLPHQTAEANTPTAAGPSPII